MAQKISHSDKPDFDKVWLMFQETRELLSESSQDTDKKFQETDRKFQATDLKFQDTDKKFQDTDKKFQDTDKKFQATDKNIKELANLFTTQWGKLIESLVEPSCVKLFQERGVPIEQSFQNVKAKRGRKEMECDIVLVNSDELVVVEVKTTFRPGYVDEFTEKLARFKSFFPQYHDYKILGAVASLKYEGQSDKYAYRNGLFVLRSTGEGIIKILNDKKFVPKGF